MDYTKMLEKLNLDVDFEDNGMYLIKDRITQQSIKRCKDLDDFKEFLEFYSSILLKN